MRVVSIATAVGAVIVGLIIADFLTHPKGTQAIAKGITDLERNTGNQLLGTPAK